MSATILYEEAAAASTNARAEGDDLWVAASELRAVSGWELKPEGICRDEICVPVPPDRAASLLAQTDGQSWLNLAEFARYTGQPYAHDGTGAVWYFGSASEDQRRALDSLEAPDFALPDLDGTVYRLSDYRGKKVFLLLWASW